MDTSTYHCMIKVMHYANYMYMYMYTECICVHVGDVVSYLEKHAPVANYNKQSGN